MWEALTGHPPAGFAAPSGRAGGAGGREDTDPRLRTCRTASASRYHLGARASASRLARASPANVKLPEDHPPLPHPFPFIPSGAVSRGLPEAALLLY